MQEFHILAGAVECWTCPPHQRPNAAATGCVCAAGYYDAWQGAALWAADGRPRISDGTRMGALETLTDVEQGVYPSPLELHCWKHSWWDEKRLDRDSSGNARCVQCPECLQCTYPLGGAADQMTIAVLPGHGLFDATAPVPSHGPLGIFKCPNNKSCNGLVLAIGKPAPPADSVTACAEGSLQDGPICAACKPGYAQDRSGCEQPCTAVLPFCPHSSVGESMDYSSVRTCGGKSQRHRSPLNEPWHRHNLRRVHHWQLGLSHRADLCDHARARHQGPLEIREMRAMAAGSPHSLAALCPVVQHHRLELSGGLPSTLLKTRCLRCGRGVVGFTDTPQTSDNIERG